MGKRRIQVYWHSYIDLYQGPPKNGNVISCRSVVTEKQANAREYDWCQQQMTRLTCKWAERQARNTIFLYNDKGNMKKRRASCSRRECLESGEEVRTGTVGLFVDCRNVDFDATTLLEYPILVLIDTLGYILWD